MVEGWEERGGVGRKAGEGEAVKAAEAASISLIARNPSAAMKTRLTHHFLDAKCNLGANRANMKVLNLATVLSAAGILSLASSPGALGADSTMDLFKVTAGHCMDGSPAAYYFRASSNESTTWVIR